MFVISNADVYSPPALGRQDVLIGGGKVLAIEGRISPSSLPGETGVIDAAGMALIPGFVDGHQHFTGGGGEGGFASRAPEMQVGMNTENGVTTAVGLLGMDAQTRSVANLYAKTEAFNADGITARMLTGSYWHPSPSITGSPEKDLVFIRPCIGVKLALADARGPHLETRDLAELAARINSARMIAGKPGFITLHLGGREQGLDLVFEAIEKFGANPRMFLPTHVNRKHKKNVDQVFALAELGAVVDATCTSADMAENLGIHSAAEVAVLADENGLFEQVAFSSDAGGSMPIWNDDKSRVIGIGVCTPDTLLSELSDLVHKKQMPLERAIRPLTITPAARYGFKGRKGEISVGADADLIVLDTDSMQIRDVIAKGQVVVSHEPGREKSDV